MIHDVSLLLLFLVHVDVNLKLWTGWRKIEQKDSDMDHVKSVKKEKNMGY